MKRAFGILSLATATLLLPVDSALAQVNGARLFEQACMTCHGNSRVERAPDPAILRKMTPERIYEAITVGAMRVQAQDLTDEAKRSIAEYLGERKLGAARIADGKLMPNQCSGNARITELSAAPAWNGWGVDIANTRFQPAKTAGLTANQVPELKLKWAFGFPGATVVYGQPTLVAGRVFVGVDTGYVYSLDAATGCVHWSFQAQAGVRNAVSIGPIRGSGSRKFAAYFGDMRGNVYGVDASSGELLWKVAADNHGIARITGAPTLYGNRLYVPVSSWEEPAGVSPNYPCCTFRGSVVALDAQTGRQIWKTYTIAEEPKPTKKNSKGVQLWAPSGGAVWGSPTIDPKRHAVYVGTGDAYTGPAPDTTDAIMAFDMETGKVLWSVQDTANDAWLAGCVPFTNGPPQVPPPATPESCPEDLGPDYDFASSPILKNMPDGHSVLVAGQKSGIVWAHDPARKGAVLWKTNLASKPPGPAGEIVWGGATDDQNAYFGLNSGGLAAVQLRNGERKWFTPLEPASPQHPGHAGALSAIDGVVFSGGWDGMLRALSTSDGRLLWEYNTAQEFTTVNGVKASGGSMGAAGPTVAGGMLVVGSGYIGVQRGMPGNVLLGFSIK
jgi:polyvinyl alcohol dehydrogenase (cytochrome)